MVCSKLKRMRKFQRSSDRRLMEGNRAHRPQLHLPPGQASPPSRRCRGQYMGSRLAAMLLGLPRPEYLKRKALAGRQNNSVTAVSLCPIVPTNWLLPGLEQRNNTPRRRAGRLTRRIHRSSRIPIPPFHFPYHLQKVGRPLLSLPGQLPWTDGVTPDMNIPYRLTDPIQRCILSSLHG